MNTIRLSTSGTGFGGGLCCDLCPTDFIPPPPTHLPEDSGSPLGVEKVGSWNYDYANGDGVGFDKEHGGDGPLKTKTTKFIEEQEGKGRKGRELAENVGSNDSNGKETLMKGLKKRL